MIITAPETKECLTCRKVIRGRVDKKFCNDYCRNVFNNCLKSPTNNLVRNINNFLGKNRRVLESLLPEGEMMVKIKKEKLLQQGYYFKYCTHLYKNKTGTTYHYCYDYGFIQLENDWVLIIKKSSEND